QGADAAALPYEATKGLHGGIGHSRQRLFQCEGRIMIHYPAYKVAAAHVAPVFLDTGRSDLAQSVEPKQFHDVVGSYNRFDVFTFSVNRSPRPPATIVDNTNASDA